MKWDWLWDLAPYVPPAALGSLIGLRYAANQTNKQRVVSFLSSAALAIMLAPALVEKYPDTFGPRLTMATGFLIALLGMDIIGGVMAVGAQFRADPSGTVRSWLDAWLGRNK